jgi:hypothetical protein
LQTVGAPHFFSIKTDLERGPKVTRMASASCVAPRRIFSRAAERNRTCLCAIADHAECHSLETETLHSEAVFLLTAPSPKALIYLNTINIMPRFKRRNLTGVPPKLAVIQLNVAAGEVSTETLSTEGPLGQRTSVELNGALRTRRGFASFLYRAPVHQDKIQLCNFHRRSIINDLPSMRTCCSALQHKSR